MLFSTHNSAPQYGDLANSGYPHPIYDKYIMWGKKFNLIITLLRTLTPEPFLELTKILINPFA